MRRILITALLLLCSASGAITVGYDIGLSQYKETSELQNSISLSQQLTNRIAMTASASFAAVRDKNLHRFIDSRSGSARLSCRPLDMVEFGINLSRSISIEKRYNELVSDRLNNTTSGQIRFTPVPWLSLDMNLGAHFIDYVNPSGDSTISGHDEGGVTGVDISANSSIFPGLSGSVQLGENRTMGQQTDTGRDQLSGRLSYSFPSIFRGGNLQLAAGAARQFTVYNDSSQSLNQDDWYNELSVVVPTPFEYVSMEISTGWDYSKRYWQDESEEGTEQGDIRDRFERSRDIASSIRYQILENLLLNMTISRTIARNDRKRGATGVLEIFDVHDIGDDRVFSASLQYTPGDSRITFERLVHLYRFDTFGTWQDKWGTIYRDNSDRDELREVLALSAEIPVSDRITLEGSMQGQSRETVYLEPEQSGNSKTSSTYSINPGFRFDAGGDWTLRESLKLSADYTTFRFPGHSAGGSNLLFRRLITSTSFQRVAQDSTTLGISHSFQFQDQGSYANSVFSRSEEVLSNVITLNFGFHVGGSIGLTPSYSWEYSRRNYVASELPALVEHMHHVGLRTRMNLAEGVLSLRVTRTFYSDKNRSSYWRATVGLNYQF